MSVWNDNRGTVAETPAGVQLEMSPQSFGVLSAPGSVVIRCLKGCVWITQEANRNDTVLDASQECKLAGAQKIYLNAWDGALLAISDALEGSEPHLFLSPWQNLRIEITRGAYALSGIGIRR